MTRPLAPSKPQERLDAGRPKLLVVDDQPLIIQVLYQTFAQDHQLFMATSGAQALALCAQHRPDLVLLDVMMPDMDGYEVCARLKANPATRDIPVIFVTAHNDEAAEAHGLDVGAVDFISKPINPKIVRARVKTHVTLKAQSDLLRSWAYMDGLTGVHNRRYFDEQLTAEWGRAVRNKAALSIVMLDVDFFKRYNDHYGHQGGDDCLRAVGEIMREVFRRAGELPVRYGGEEFAVILPGVNQESGLKAAEKLLKALAERAIPHARSDAAAHVSGKV